MRANLEDNLARKLRLSAAQFGTLESVVTTAFNVRPDGPQFLFLNPGAATIQVFLPPITKMGGQLYIIGNSGTGSLVINSSSGVALITISPNGNYIFISSPTAWHVCALSSSSITSVPGGPFFIFNDPVNGILARPIVSSDLPAAMFAAIGGIKAIAPVTGKVLYGIDEGGAPVLGPAREILTANRNYFVDAARPDDSGDGLTAGTAWKTMQKAVDVVASIDLSSFNIIINVASGTYTQPVNLKSYIGAGPVVFLGPASPNFPVLSTTGANCVTANGVIGRWVFDNFKFTSTGVGFGCLSVIRASQVDIQLGVEFGPCNAAHVNLTNTALVNITCPVTISGSASSHIAAAANCTFACAGRAITFVGAPAFSNNFLQAVQGGIISYNNNTFTGTCTGLSAAVASNAVIDTQIGTNTGAAAYLPGSHTFTEASGGVLI